jgi:hypothetical protein
MAVIRHRPEIDYAKVCWLSAIYPRLGQYIGITAPNEIAMPISD